RHPVGDAQQHDPGPGRAAQAQGGWPGLPGSDPGGRRTGRQRRDRQGRTPWAARSGERGIAKGHDDGMTIEHKRSSKGEIEDLIRARYSLIWITSPEETRVEEALRKLCVEREMRLEVWSITEGFKTIANGQGTRDVKDPMKAIDHVMRAEGK